ncbi:hypothetical protein WOLCODRAFT_140069, partial [Wolfiporia cocos MD-104 SS10]
MERRYVHILGLAGGCRHARGEVQLVTRTGRRDSMLWLMNARSVLYGYLDAIGLSHRQPSGLERGNSILRKHHYRHFVVLGWGFTSLIAQTIGTSPNTTHNGWSTCTHIAKLRL